MLFRDDDCETYAEVSLAPHELAAIAAACKEYSAMLAELHATGKDREIEYYGLLAVAFRAMALATAYSYHIRSPDEKKAALSLQVFPEGGAS